MQQVDLERQRHARASDAHGSRKRQEVIRRLGFERHVERVEPGSFEGAVVHGWRYGVPRGARNHTVETCMWRDAAKTELASDPLGGNLPWRPAVAGVRPRRP